MRRAKQFTGYEKRPNVMGIGFFAELFTHVGQWGANVDFTAHFSKELVTVDQIDVNEIVLPLVVIDVHDEAAKNLDLRAIARAREKRRNVESGTIAVLRNCRSKPGHIHAVYVEYMCQKCSFGELTESRGTNEGTRRVYAHYRYYAGRFSHVFVRVLSAENCGGGRDSISNDS